MGGCNCICDYVTPNLSLQNKDITPTTFNVNISKDYNKANKYRPR